MTLRIFGILNSFTSFLMANLGKPIDLAVISKWNETMNNLIDAIDGE